MVLGSGDHNRMKKRHRSSAMPFSIYSEPNRRTRSPGPDGQNDNLPSASHQQQDRLVARRAKCRLDSIYGFNRLAIDLHYDVAPRDTGFGGRASPVDLGYDHSFGARRHVQLPGGVGSQRLQAEAELAVFALVRLVIFLSLLRGR